MEVIWQSIVLQIHDTIDRLSDGFGCSVQEIVEETGLDLTKIHSAIEYDLFDPEGSLMTFSKGLDGPIALRSVVNHYLIGELNKGLSLSCYVDIMMGILNHQIEAWILISNIEMLIHHGYVEVDKMLTIKKVM